MLLLMHALALIVLIVLLINDGASDGDATVVMDSDYQGDGTGGHFWDVFLQQLAVTRARDAPVSLRCQRFVLFGGLEHETARGWLAPLRQKKSPEVGFFQSHSCE